MKTIIFFHPSSDLYGSDKMFLQYVDQFKRYKKIIVLRLDGPLVAKLREIENVEIFFDSNMPILAKKYLNIKGCFMLLNNLIRFRKSLKRIKGEDCIGIYLNTIATVLVLLYFDNNTKKIIHLHETMNTKNLFYKNIIRFVAKRADWILCVSNAVLSPVKNVINVRYISKIKKIYNGIELQSSGRKNNYSVDHSKINMALIGRIKPEMKGQLFLIDAVASLTKEQKGKVIFHIVGSTVSGQEYMLDEVKAYIRDKNLEKVFKISEFINDVASLYDEMDVILVPSLCEDSLPTTVIEAMYFQKPVIATVSGGIPEMIHDGVNGILVRKNDVKQLSEAIIDVIENKEKRLQMGVKSKEEFEKNFSKKVFEQNYSRLLTEIFN